MSLKNNGDFNTRGIGNSTIENKPRLLTLKEASKLIQGLTEYRIKTMCLKGELKFFKFGNKYMISEQEIYNYFMT